MYKRPPNAGRGRHHRGCIHRRRLTLECRAPCWQPSYPYEWNTTIISSYKRWCTHHTLARRQTSGHPTGDSPPRPVSCHRQTAARSRPTCSRPNAHRRNGSGRVVSQGGGGARQLRKDGVGSKEKSNTLSNVIHIQLFIETCKSVLSWLITIPIFWSF